MPRARPCSASSPRSSILAVAGSTGSATPRSPRRVTLSLDGERHEVRRLGDTVGDVLEAEGIEVGTHDVVAPALDEPVSDGSKIAVSFGRPLELSVDGETTTHWVTATDVASGAGPDRPPLRRRRPVRQPWRRHRPRRPRVEVVTAKKTVTDQARAADQGREDGAHRAHRGGRPEPSSTSSSTTTTASSRPSTRGRRRRQGRGDPDPGGRPSEVDKEAIDFATVEREDDSACTRTSRDRRDRAARRPAQRDLQADLPQRRARRAPRCIDQQGARAARSTAIVKVGTREAGAPTSPAAAPSGTSSRSASPAATGRSTPATATTAACSSASAPGSRTAAPGYPHQPAARPRSRSRRKLRDAPTGGYGCLAGTASPSGARPSASVARRLPTSLPGMSLRPPARDFSGRRTCVRWRPGSDLRPTKQRGQNFVIDPNTVRRIVRESGVGGRRRGARGRAGAGLADAGAARRRGAGGRHRDRRAAGGRAARDGRGVRPRPRRPVRGRARRRAAGDRAAGRAADRAGRQPALQRLGAGAAAPAGAAAVAASTGW